MSRLMVGEHEVVIRMYRVGHGDCFLLALPREGGGDPVYVLIDCGYKPGSPKFVHDRSIGDIVAHIGEATGYQLDLVILTHEHQDHLNGIWKETDPYFGAFTIKEAWLAWTEDPADPLANELRDRHRDQILSLVAARQNLAALGLDEADAAVRRLDSLLALELGSDEESLTDASFVGFLGALHGATGAPADRRERDTLVTVELARSPNKQALKLVRDKAAEHRGVSYLRPGGAVLGVAGSKVQSYVLGPPYDAELLSDEDPRGSEVFPDETSRNLTFGGAIAGPNVVSPFSQKYGISAKHALEGGVPFFTRHYGSAAGAGDENDPSRIVADDASWRRIDDEWLYSAESLALKLNTGVNNTSLVIGFELPATRKVLLFVGDAQRGNWVSWSNLRWQDGDREVTARDLLGRTIVYKVGHHGSHNATLNGREDDDQVSLAWMGRGAAAREFTAMITAVEEWAQTKNKPPWKHPLPAIKRALLQKAQGRVFQTDTDDLTQPTTVSDTDWNAFLARTDRDAASKLYFDYRVLDE